jgi:cytochrome c-type biogenesis protein CcmH/NrfF
VTETTTLRHAQMGARRAQRLLVATVAALLLAVGAVSFAPLVACAEIATQYQTETDLTCQCGCGLTVHSCNHLNCGSGIPLKKEIGEQIATGKSREEILAYFTTKYGEKILSSPTTTGFNIAAWTVPFVVIGLGGLIIGVVLVRWRRATDVSDAPVAAPPSTTDPELKAKLDRALDDLDRRV